MDETFDAKVKAWFLGPKAENAKLMEELVTDVLRDHAFWRRNLHTEDPAVISERDKHSTPFDESVMLLRQELFDFLSRLKAEVPLFSPRYCAHMTSEQLIPAMVGYFAAMLYNPNNISAEASTVTTQLELEVGEQLAALAGFDPDHSWGHLCSGGSAANFEALWLARNLKYLPFSALLAAQELELAAGVEVQMADGHSRELQGLSAFEMFNVPASEAAQLRECLVERCLDVHFAGEHSAEHRQGAWQRVDQALARHSVQHLGLWSYHQRLAQVLGEEVAPPVCLVPQNKHYSWVKSMSALGMGEGQLRGVALAADFAMGPSALHSVLDQAAEQRQPVLMLVNVLGSTELGAIDPLHKIEEVARQARERGLYAYRHLDAAWGGYLLSALRDAPGGAAQPSSEPKSSTDWPTAEVKEAMLAASSVDSITIDPHKQGHIPYPAGAVVFREKCMRDAIVSHAPYAFDQTGKESTSTFSIGQYTLEGSRPGAAAAAVWLAHRLVPLNREGYGRIASSSASSARAFHAALVTHRGRSQDFVLEPLCSPDSNLVCYAANRRENRSLAEMNAINTRIYQLLNRPASDDQTLDFFVSKTHLSAATYGELCQEFLGRLGVSTDTFRTLDQEPAEDAATEIVVLRSTFMNPWFQRSPEGPEYYLQLMLKKLAQAAEIAIREVRRSETIRDFYVDTAVLQTGV